MVSAERDRPDVARRRRWWRRWQESADPRDVEGCIFIDETALRTDLTRTRGRAPKGERLPGAVPSARWRTSTLVAAMGLNGVTCSMAMEGAMNREAFELFVEKVLVPRLVPGQTVVMDNLSAHRGRRVRRLIRAAGCRVAYLPPYSFDLNPIELLFSKLKALLRGVAARTIEALWQAAGAVANAVTPAETANFFNACGYRTRYS